MLKRNLVVILVVLFVAGTSVFAGGGREAAGEPGVVQLTFRQNDPPAEVAGLMEAIADWNRENPGIQVRTENVPWADALNQFIREGQASGGPDVLQVAFVWTADLGRGELIMNLDDIVRRSPPGAGIDDFLGTDLGEVEGSLFGIPWTVDTFVMVYRPDLFAEVGVTAFPDTWEAFYRAVRDLTRDTTGDGRINQYGFGFPAGSASGGGMWFLANYYLWSNGSTFVEQRADGTWQIGTTASEVAETMRYFNRFFSEGLTPASLIGVSSWGDPELTGGLARGDLAIGFFAPQTFRAAQSQSDLPLATAMIPRGSERRISHLGGRALAINANTKHPEESWQFLKYLISRNVFERYEQFPAQETLLGELVFPEGEQGYADQLPHAITFKQYIESPAPVSGLWDATNREFGAVFSGQKSIDRAAADLLAAMERLLQNN